MAVLPDYVSGTISLANGSTTVTGTGTLFQVAAFKAGDTLQIQNLTAIIASVNSNTSLTLTAPWTGTTLTNAPYRARYLPDGARVTAQTTTMIELLGNGNLQSLAGLTGAADKGIMFTGAGTAGTFDLTAYTRELLASTSASSAKASLELGNVNNTSDANKPISTATQTALNGKASLSGATFSGTVRSQAGIEFGGSAMGRLNGYNSSGDIVMESGIGVGTGYGDSFGFNLRTVGGEMAFFTNSGQRRMTINNVGQVVVTGALSKGSGTFLIDHPIDPFNKNLRHGFVESTEYVNIYRGMADLVDGRMTVDIDAAFNMTDGTFAALNADVMVTALQNQFGPERVWVEAPADSGKFTIICEDTDSTATIAWMVTGRRNDAFVRSDLDPNTDSEGRFIPEFDKPEFEENEDG